MPAFASEYHFQLQPICLTLRQSTLLKSTGFFRWKKLRSAYSAECNRIFSRYLARIVSFVIISNDQTFVSKWFHQSHISFLNIVCRFGDPHIHSIELRTSYTQSSWTSVQREARVTIASRLSSRRRYCSWFTPETSIGDFSGNWLA